MEFKLNLLSFIYVFIFKNGKVKLSFKKFKKKEGNIYIRLYGTLGAYAFWI